MLGSPIPSQTAARAASAATARPAGSTRLLGRAVELLRVTVITTQIEVGCS